MPDQRLVTSSFTQPFSIDWYKVAGSGGTSSGTTYSMSSIIGQHDAGNAKHGSTCSSLHR